MTETAVYHTTVHWKGEHWGHIVMGNGPEMDFSAPPDAQGHAGVFTPEDAFVAAANTCIMMMFIWAAERFKLKLLSYECRAEGTKRIEIDRTEIFTHLRFWPVIRVATGGEKAEVVLVADQTRPPVRPKIQPGRQFGEIGNHHRTPHRIGTIVHFLIVHDQKKPRCSTTCVIHATRSISESGITLSATPKIKASPAARLSKSLKT